MLRKNMRISHISPFKLSPQASQINFNCENTLSTEQLVCWANTAFKYVCYCTVCVSCIILQSAKRLLTARTGTWILVHKWYIPGNLLRITYNCRITVECGCWNCRVADTLTTTHHTNVMKHRLCTSSQKHTICNALICLSFLFWKGGYITPEPHMVSEPTTIHKYCF